MAAKRQKQVGAMLDEQAGDNNAWRARMLSADATQRSDAQAVLNRVRDEMLSANRRASGSAAMSGASEESVAAQKGASAQAIAQAAADVQRGASAREDQVESTYEARKRELANSKMQMRGSEAAAIGAATSSIAGAIGRVGEAYDDYVSAK